MVYKRYVNEVPSNPPVFEYVMDALPIPEQHEVNQPTRTDRAVRSHLLWLLSDDSKLPNRKRTMTPNIA
jgi:hypothetical protein